jgi:hypothetical protein
VIQRFFAGVVLAVLVVGCSGNANPTNSPGPGSTATPGPTATSDNGGQTPGSPTDNPTTNPGGGGDITALVQALIPAGATESGRLSLGGSLQVYLTSTASMADLESFWDQAIPANGMTESGKFTAEGILTIAITNPDGGIVATPNDDGTVGIVISLGTSS